MNHLFRANTALLLAAAVSTMSVVSGCKSATPNPAAGPDAAQSAPPPPPGAAAPAAPQMSVADLVAPIALYPDKLLAQILAASTNPQEVLDGGNWLLQNQTLKGDALANAAKGVGLSPSMQYLTAFPQVVDNMCQQIDWTTQLGQAFQANPKAVMDAIQQKRVEAQQLGNLKSSPQMTVATKTENGQSYVEIQPADPQVVYVPQYNPVTIYNTPAPPATTTVVTQQSSGVSTGTAVAIGLLSFGVGMAIGSTFNNNNYYPYPAWGYGHVYYGGRPYYPPPYRPVYPGYRPAYGYRPPPNYHWSNYNQSINTRYNNNNYYSRYNNNSVRNTNVNVNVNANNRPANQPNWKGQSTYQGARPATANNARPGASMAAANPTNRPNTNNNGSFANRPNGNNNAALANRPNAANNGSFANRPGAGNAGTMRPPAAGNTSAMARPAATPANMNRGGDRGYGNTSARPAGGSSPAARPAPQAQNRGGGGNNAFSASGSAQSERAASNRGQASFGGGGGRGKRH